MFVLRADGTLFSCLALTIPAALNCAAVSGASQSKVLHADATHGAASSIYRRNMNITLTIKHLVVWTADDPFDGASSTQQLNSYVGYNRSYRTGIQRDLSHLLANSTFNGGIAYINELCSNSYGCAVSNISTGYSFPVLEYAWDVDVVAHETGHNFESPLTHCYSPPIDCCYNNETCSKCSYSAPELGTIMSYCHLSYPGTQLRFHERVAALIRSRAEAAACISAVQSACSYSPSSTSGSFGSNGGNGSFSVQSQTGCQWVVQSDSWWLTISDGWPGIGTGTVNYSLQPNTTSQTRTGRIAATGTSQVLTVTQAGLSCAYTLATTAASFGAGGINVQTGANCEWRAEVDMSWVRFTTPTSGTGSAWVDYALEPNYSINKRTAVIAIPGTGLTHTIRQGGSNCLEGVLWPDGGETLVRRSRYRITWEQGCLPHSSVTIELWRNGAKVTTLAKGMVNDGLQGVRIPGDVGPGGGYRIHIKCEGGPWLAPVL